MKREEAINVMQKYTDTESGISKVVAEAHEMAIKALEQETKTDKALNLLSEWAVECGFGYDNIPEQYEKYKDNIADMGYAEGLAYIAKMERED